MLFVYQVTGDVVCMINCSIHACYHTGTIFCCEKKTFQEWSVAPDNLDLGFRILHPELCTLNAVGSEHTYTGR